MSAKTRRKLAAATRDVALIAGVSLAGSSSWAWDIVGIACLVAYAFLVELLTA